MSTWPRLVALPIVIFAAWFLTTRGLPFLLVRVGRLLGFRMRATPLMERRIQRFKSIRRGYVCFVVVCTAFVGSLFLELVVNHRPLYIRYGDHVRFPAVADWLDTALPFLNLPTAAPASAYGLEGEAEVPYRDYARWVSDPDLLTAGAARIEQEIREDEARYREGMEQTARDSGQDYDPAAPLPDFKQHEYADRREHATRLSALKREILAGRVGIVMPLYPYSPREQLLSLAGTPPHPPFRSGLPLLGTDPRGRDILSQLLYGFRISFAFALLVSLIGYTIGVTVGAVMGYFGGWVDIGVQRFIEVWSTIPFLFTLMILAAIYEPSFVMLAILLVVLRAWINITFTIRGEFYREKARDYVQAARAVGVRTRTIMRRHILPNSLVPIVTFLPFEVVGYVETLVALDYLGFGLPSGTPSWGDLIRQGAENILTHPDLLVAPILALAATLFAVVMIGEAVREAFDPKVYSRLR